METSSKGNVETQGEIGTIFGVEIGSKEQRSYVQQVADLGPSKRRSKVKNWSFSGKRKGTKVGIAGRVPAT